MGGGRLKTHVSFFPLALLYEFSSWMCGSLWRLRLPLGSRVFRLVEPNTPARRHDSNVFVSTLILPYLASSPCVPNIALPQYLDFLIPFFVRRPPLHSPSPQSFSRRFFCKMECPFPSDAFLFFHSGLVRPKISLSDRCRAASLPKASGPPLRGSL